jgi:uncharacterized protein (DUF2342 family)
MKLLLMPFSQVRLVDFEGFGRMQATDRVQVGANNIDGWVDSTFDVALDGVGEIWTMEETTETKSQPKVPMKAKTMRSL